MRTPAEQFEIVCRAYVHQKESGDEIGWTPLRIARELGVRYQNATLVKQHNRMACLKRRIARVGNPDLWLRKQPTRIVTPRGIVVA